MQTENAVEITKKNDVLYRCGFGVVPTPEVHMVEDLSGLIDEVCRFDELTDNNALYGEHDFGAVH